MQPHTCRGAFNVGRGSHYSELLSYVSQRCNDSSYGIAVTSVAPLFSRTDGPRVFDEGRLFSGPKRFENTEACLTIPASPYVPSTIPMQTYLAAARKSYPDLRLPPGLSRAVRLPGHLTLWWRFIDESSLCSGDFIQLGGLTSRDKYSCCTCIETVASNAIQILLRAGGKPVITGSWGNGSRADRGRLGLTRGVPTNQMGHLHIVCYETNTQSTTLVSELPASEIIKHFSPWNHLVQQKLAHGIKCCINNVLEQSLSDFLIDTSVSVLDLKLRFRNGAVAHQEGYVIEFSRDLNLKWVLAGLMDVAAKFEGFYKELTYHYSVLQRSEVGSEQHDDCMGRIRHVARNFGFTSGDAETLLDFILKIRPTYGQMLTWEEECTTAEELKIIRGSLRRYRRHARRLALSDSAVDDARLALIRDTYVHPQHDTSINNTWPVHLSASYLVDEYRVVGDDIAVRSLKLFPGIGSSISATERVLGTAIRR